MWAPQSPLVGHATLALLGNRPPLLPGGLPKPPGGLLLMGLDLPDLQPRSPPHHRQSTPARLGPTSRHPPPGHASPNGHYLTPTGRSANPRTREGRRGESRRQVAT